MGVPDDHMRCEGRDNGRRCIRKRQRREYCRKHYERWRRKGGETRTEREIQSIEARARRREELTELARKAGLPVPDPIFGGTR